MQERHPAGPGRIVAHALWLGTLAVLVAALVLLIVFAAAPGSDRRLEDAASLLVLAVLLTPLWGPGVVLFAALSGFAAWAALEVGRRLRGDRPAAVRALLGALGAAAVPGAAAAAWLLDGGLGPLPALCALLSAAAAGSGAIAFAERGRHSHAQGRRQDQRTGAQSPPAGAPAAPTAPAGRRGHRGTAAVWALSGAALGAAGWLLGARMALATGFVYDTGEKCARVLAGAGAGAPLVYASTPFPPRSWCLAGDAVVSAEPGWSSALLVALLAAALLCLVVALGMALRRRTAPGSSADRRLRLALPLAVALLAALGAASSAAAGLAGPPAEQLAQAHQLAAQAQEQQESQERVPAQPPVAPAPPAEASGPPVSLAAARAQLDALAEQAGQAGGSALLWTVPLVSSERDCVDAAGRAGTVVELTGRFTSRPLGSPADDLDYLAITQDNEAVASRIVAAWLDGGTAGGSDRLHGEWWLGPAPGGALDLIHLGFADGEGDIRASSACAAAP